jgi:ATP-dependent DNA helicase RecQ
MNETQLRVQDQLKAIFGFDELRGGQGKVVEKILAGNNVLALFPTGAGKSLCYQLPAVLLPGLTLVISPLIALMKDQVEFLMSRGVAAARLDSSLSAKEVGEVYQKIKEGKLKLLYLAPERLLQEGVVEKLKNISIDLMAVDEAHCISEWGHSFRPVYLRLAMMAKVLKVGRLLALTATARPEVARAICDGFSIQEQDWVQTGFRRENLIYEVFEGSHKLSWLKGILNSEKGAVVIYVTLQKTAEELATLLQKQGFLARAYHAGMNHEHREEAQNLFMDGRVQVIVATIAFGMGIDKADIRRVVHWNMPKSIENYIQETGRAGRDGKEARVTFWYDEKDGVVLRNFIYADLPTETALSSLLEHVFLQGDELELSIYQISVAYDIRSTVVESILTKLELQGYLQPMGQFYAEYKYQQVSSDQQILRGHTVARQDLLKRILGLKKKSFLKYHQVRLAEFAEVLGEPQERILSALQWLHESGDIVLIPSQVRQRWRKLAKASSVDLGKLGKQMMGDLIQREKMDLVRIEQVEKIASLRSCLTEYLLEYFGEKVTVPCGQCGICYGEKKIRENTPKTVQKIEEVIDWELVKKIRQDHFLQLRQDRSLAFFLTGIRSPALTAARLTRDENFGIYQEFSFKEVYEILKY